MNHSGTILKPRFIRRTPTCATRLLLITFIIGFTISSSVNAATTNIISQVVSFLFENTVAEALTTGRISSPVASFQFLDSAQTGNVQVSQSKHLSYVYKLPPPPLNVITINDRVPSKQQLMPPRISAPTNLIPAATLDTGFKEKMTIVLTHGWIPEMLSLSTRLSKFGVPAWPTKMAKLFIERAITNKANIFMWDWRDGATRFTADRALANTFLEGFALADALFKTYGPGYQQKIHFIGHSLGTVVNASCANHLAVLGYKATNFHMTLFDESEIVNYQGIAGSRDLYRSIPNEAEWIDSYITWSGYNSLIHDRSQSVIVALDRIWIDGNILFKGLIHSHPQWWYGETIRSNVDLEIGFSKSHEGRGLVNPRPEGTVFIQNPLFGSIFDFHIYEPNQEVNPVFQGIAKRYNLFNKDKIVPVLSVVGEILSVGNSVVRWVADHTSKVDGYELVANLNGSKKEGLRGQSIGSSSAFLWIPIFINEDIAGLSVDFALSGLNGDELFVLGVGTNTLFSTQTRFLPQGEIKSTGIMDVSQWAGQRVELFFGLVNSNQSQGEIEVSGLKLFPSVHPPLQIDYAGTNILLRWPASASLFDLECTTNVFRGDWKRVNNELDIFDGEFGILSGFTETSQFFRLRRRVE